KAPTPSGETPAARERGKHCLRLPEKRKGWRRRLGAQPSDAATPEKEHRSKDRPLHETQDGSTRKGSRDGMFLELLDVALFDLAHELFAAEEIIAEMAGELARDNE